MVTTFDRELTELESYPIFNEIEPKLRKLTSQFTVVSGEIRFVCEDVRVEFEAADRKTFEARENFVEAKELSSRASRPLEPRQLAKVLSDASRALEEAEQAWARVSIAQTMCAELSRTVGDVQQRFHRVAYDVKQLIASGEL